MPPGDVLVELRGVTQDYHALRPLRIHLLEVRQGQSLALIGFDLAMAELLVNLITGGEYSRHRRRARVRRLTRDITSAEEWVGTLDKFGLISERAVLVDQFTVEQNLALPLSLDIERCRRHCVPRCVSSPTKCLCRPTP